MNCTNLATCTLNPSSAGHSSAATTERGAHFDGAPLFGGTVELDRVVAAVMNRPARFELDRTLKRERKKEPKTESAITIDTSAPVYDHSQSRITPQAKRHAALKSHTPSKKDMWWIDDKMQQERERYDTQFNRRLGIEDAYSMKLAKLKKQRERELIGKSFKAWKNRLEMQSGIESAILSLHDKIGNTEVCDIAESVLLLTYNLARATNVMDYVMAAISFMKSRSPGPILSKAFRKQIVPFVNSILTDNEIVEMQSGLERGLATAKDVLKVWPRIKSSPLWRKVNSVVVFTTAMTLFGTDVTRAKALKVEDQYYHNRNMMQADFVHNVLDLLLFVAERGLQVVKNKSIDPMFHSGSEYETWYDDAADVIAKSKFLCNPEVHGIDVHTFTSHLDGLIAKGQSMYKFACELDRGAKGVVRATVAQLLSVRATYLNKKVGQRTRKAPLAIVLEGHSSVGKTTFANILHYYYGTLCQKNTSYGSRYTRMPTAEFWNSFSSDQWSLLIDDAAAFKPSALNDIDPTIKELLQIVNNAPLSANMASLEEKGACPFLGELVVATTNTPDLNLDHYFNVPGAVARRFPFHVRVRPLPEYRKTITMLDEKRVAAVEPGRYPDWWDIEILEPVLEPASLDESQEFKMTFSLVSMKKGMRMKEFLKWYHGVIVNHNTVQTKVSLCEESLRMTALCTGCHLPSGMCDCLARDDPPDLLRGNVNASDAIHFGDIEVPVEPLLQSGYETHIDEETYAGQVLWQLGVTLCHWWFFGGLTLINAIFWTGFIWTCRCYWQHIWDIFALGPSRKAFLLAQLFVERFAQNIQALWTRRLHQGADVVWHYSREARDALGRCGDRVVIMYYQQPRICLLIIAVLSVALVAFGAYTVFMKQKPDVNLQGPLLSTLGEKPAGEGETENVWKREVYTPSTYDLGRTTLSWKNEPEESVNRILGRNSCFVRFKVGDDWKVAKCIALGGQYYMTTNHTVPLFDDHISCQMVRSVDVKGVTNTVKFLLSAKDVKRDHDKDICIFRVRSAPPARKILELFAKKALKNYRGEGYYLGRNTDGSVFNRPVKGIYLGEHYNSELKSTLQIYWGTVSEPTSYGDCGAMLLTRTPSGPVILGMHQLGGRSSTVGAVRVTYEDIMDLLGDAILVGDSEPMLDAESTNVGIPGPVHFKSPVNYVLDGTLDCHGSFTGWRSEPRFNVQRSVLAPFLETQGFAVEHGPPMVKGWKPKYDAMVELSTLYPEVDTDIVDTAVEGFVNDLKFVDRKWLKQIQIYDIHTAINGVPGLKYVDGIKRSTSAGFPYGKPKQAYLVQLEPTEDYPDHVMVNEEVRGRIQEMINRYSEGNRAGSVFRMALKNEALPIEKARKGKVRSFTMACVELTIVMRMYTLSFVRVSQSNHFLFECAPGIEAQSCEWDFLYQYLTQFGTERCVFGDFKGFDKSMHPVFILAAFEVIARFHEFAGATREHVNVIRCIAYDIAFAHVDFFGDLVTLYGKNPSGQALTAHINGLVNSLYMRFVWIHCSPFEDAALFKQNVALITYGDDNGMGVSDRAPFFNHTTIAETLVTIGVTYTMADKESASVPYISIAQGSFLKRSWRWCEETRTYVGPLELASLSKMLMVVVPSSVVSPEIQAVDTLRSANSEYFWHGREMFDKHHTLLQHAIVACNLQVYMQAPLESWDDLMLRYKKASLQFLETAEVHPFVDTSQYRFEILQSGIEPETDSRMCLHCGRMRFDDYDVDCEHCGRNDTCELCGRTEDTVSASLYAYLPYPLAGGQHCVDCRHDLVQTYPCTRCGMTGCESWLIDEVEDLDDFPPCIYCGRCELRTDRWISRCGHCYRDGDPGHPVSEGAVAALRQILNGLHPGDGETSGGDAVNQITPPTSILAPKLTLEEGAVASSVDARDPEPCPTIGVLSRHNQGPRTAPRAGNQSDDHRPTQPQDQEFHLQSGMEGGSEQNIGGDVMSSTSSDVQTQQTATFVDSGVGDTLSFAEASDRVFTYDKQNNAELGDFLSRPRLIQSVTWTPGVLSTTTFDPWSLYLATTEIAYKLNNYAWFRGTLRIKVVTNAAPFYYGALLMYYTPLPASMMPLSSTTGVKLQQSQRPHIWILPQNNEGGEMTIPFIFPKNYVAITSAADVAKLGNLTFTAYTQLTSANGATSNGVQIQVYAWMENVSLFGPTVGLAMQAGDEYGNGPVSAPAAAVAHWATYLSRVPIIGRFAKATSIGASAVSQVAKLFGWSNVPVIQDVQPYKNVPFHDLASAHISEPTSKFLLDPKGELSVDPALVGIGSEDELSISHLVQKESYLATATWTAGAPASTLLFSCAVCPWMSERGTASGAGTYALAMTPMAWVGAAFQNWRGDIIFRFKVICSKFHSGRLRIHWDPTASLSSTSDCTHVTYSAILDIQESDEVEFRVPYMQALSWQENLDTAAGNQWSTSGVVGPISQGNGSLAVRVLNNLTAPIDTATCSILVFVRGAENLEFANPRDLLKGNSFFGMQSGTEPCQINAPLDERYLVNWGEPIPSVRLLLRRSSLVDRIVTPRTSITATDEMGLIRLYQSRLPPTPGYDNTAWLQAKGIETPATTYQFTYSNMTYMAWFAASFVAMRGATRWHYNLVNPDGTLPYNVTVTRRSTNALTAVSGQLEGTYVSGSASTGTTQSLLKGKMWNNLTGFTGQCGVALTNPYTQTGVSVEYPMMTNYIFQFANPRTWLIGTSSDGSDKDNYAVEVEIHPAAGLGQQRMQIQRYASAGTDFALHMFLNTPVVNYNPGMGSVPV